MVVAKCPPTCSVQGTGRFAADANVSTGKDECGLLLNWQLLVGGGDDGMPKKDARVLLCDNNCFPGVDSCQGKK